MNITEPGTPFNLLEVIPLLEQADKHGIRIAYDDGQLIIKVQKGRNVDPAFLSSLKEKKSLLLLYYQKRKEELQHFATRLSVIKPAGDRGENIPLSYSQERLWFIDKLDGSVPYHISTTYYLKGKLQLSLFEQSLQFVVNRHEALRTVFREIDGVPYQSILPQDSWKMTVIAQEEQPYSEDQLKKMVAELIAEPFDLSKDHMLRITLIEQQQEQYLMVVTMHHIASDGWSLPIIVNETIEVYTSKIEQRLPALQPLSVQYADYSIWQREQFSEDRMKNQLSYWERKLAATEPLLLPTDFPRPSIQSTNGAATGFKVNKDVSDKLSNLSRKSNTTLFMLLLSAFKVLLYRYSSQTDICVGTPIANRGYKEIEPLVGYFANTIVFRSDLDGNPSFLELLQQVKTTTLEGYENQDTPIEKLVQSLIKNRDMGRGLFFQVMFIVQNTPDIPDLKLPGVEIEYGPLKHTTSKFDLTLAIEETPHGFRADFEYCTDLFDVSTIHRMQQHFSNILRSISEDPSVRIGDIDMAGDTEKEILTAQFGHTPAPDYDQQLTILDLFRRQVKQQPDSIALSCNGKSLTYRELDEKSNQLASFITAKKIGTGARIVLALDRSLNLVVCLLGVLKTGAAYVPVDTEYPADRIRFIAVETGAALMITEKFLEAEWKDLSHAGTCELLTVNNGINLWDDQQVQYEGRMPQPDDLAYILYTSGTTGVPKGVLITHASLTHYTAGFISYFNIAPSDNVIQQSSVSFDTMVEEIFPALSTGASVTIAAGGGRDVDALIQLIYKGEVTVLSTTPHVIDFLNQELKHTGSLRILISGGDVLKPSSIERLIEMVPVYNTYGPSETTVCALYHRVRAAADASLLGRPCPGTTVLVLNPHGKLNPVGVPGEIYIGGAGVAKGYLDRPELTRQKFVQALIEENNDARFFRTGDIGYWTADGELLFNGRADSQFKINGYRVEPDEIEKAALDSGLLRNVVIKLIQHTTGHKEVVGYIVPLAGYSGEGLITYLHSRLPSFMIPSRWVELDTLPLLSNGKIDHRSLTVISNVAASDAAVPELPANTTEEKLLTIWQAFLKNEITSVNENFFSLGGHSLLATRVLHAIKKEFDTSITLKDIFFAPTIRLLAARILQTGKDSVEPGLSDTTDPVGKIPLSYNMERLWFIDQLQGSLSYHIPLMLKLEGAFDPALFEDACKQLVQRHSILRTVIRNENGIPFQELLPSGSWSMEFSNLTDPQSDQAPVSEQLERFSGKEFDLANDHFFRVMVLQQTEKLHYLCIVLHHIAGDGWSVDILTKEMASFYNSKLKGEEPLLPPSPVQYHNYSLWQRSTLTDEILQHRIEAVRSKLTGVAPINILTDFERPLVMSFDGAEISRTIDAEAVAKLRKVCEAEEVTLFMLLLSVYKVLLYKYSHDEDLCVGIPVAGRNLRETENAVGFFVNTVAVRTVFSSSQSFRSLLAQVKNGVLDAFDNQDAPFEKVIEALNIPRDLNRHPVFQTVFQLQNNTSQPITHIGDCRISPVYPGQFKVKFDLTLEVSENADDLSLHLAYCKELYSEETMRQMLGHYVALVNAVAENTDLPLYNIPMLSAADEQQLLQGFNNSARDYGASPLIMTLFDQQCKNVPRKMAVLSDAGSISFEELNERANFLSMVLKSKLVAEGSLVAICQERSVEMIVSILAVLKAGAAYIPVDPALPVSRIRRIVDDSHPLCMLTQRGVVTDDGAWFNGHLVFADEIKGRSKTGPAIEIKDQDPLLCVIYTSGSTGNPNGVLIRNSNLYNRIAWMKEMYPFTTDERSALKTSLSFVDHLWELFGPLTSGISTVIISKDEIFRVDLLLAKISHYGITRMVLVPALLNEILRAIPEDEQPVPFPFIWSCSGDILNDYSIRLFYARFPNGKLLNIYGSTEVTADVTLFDTSSSVYDQVPGLTSGLFDLSFGDELNTLAETFLERKKIIGQTDTASIPFVTFGRGRPVTMTAPQYVSFLREMLLPNMVNIGSSSFIGHMTAPVPLFLRELNALMIALNQNLVKIETSGAATSVEKEVLAIIHREVFRFDEQFYQANAWLPGKCLGVVTGGGSVSNITALSYALNASFKADGHFRGFAEEGLVSSLAHYNYSGVVLIGSPLMHYSIEKALRLLGLGRKASVVFDFDKNDPEQSRADLHRKIKELRAERLHVLAIVGVAGATETGTIDPLDELAAVAAAEGIHFHVDGAFGGPYIFSEKLAVKLRGIEHADTVAICGHKQMYMPLGASVCLFKDPGFAIYSANTTNYQARKGSFDLGRYTIEGSRPFVSLLFHGLFSVFGTKRIGQVMEYNFERAVDFASLVDGDPAFQLLFTPETNIVNYRYVPALLREKAGLGLLNEEETSLINDINIRLQQQQFLRGNSFVSYSLVKNSKAGGKTAIVALRMVIMNPASDNAIFRSFLEEQKDIAGQFSSLPVTVAPDIFAYERSWSASVNNPSAIVSIGKPVPNCRVYVLDEYGNLCPPGVSGELYVAGKQLSDGYLIRNDLTKKRFITKNVGQNITERLFRTGDLCRWRADGSLQYLGRKDQQIKIRGYRIEPGEIEAALYQLQDIRQCAVVAGEDASGNQQLRGYVVTENEFDQEKVMIALRSYLPEYMLPSLWMELPALPLNASGKVDRLALPAPETSEHRGSSYMAPSDETETILCGIWEELLGIKRVGVGDSFFALGGHSLLAMRMVAAIRAALGIDIAVKTVFEFNTIKLLAKFLKISFEAARISGTEDQLAQPELEDEMNDIEVVPGQIAYDVKAMIDLIGEANAAGVRLNYENGQLSVGIKKNTNVSQEILDKLKASKTNLLSYYKKYKAAVISTPGTSVIPVYSDGGKILLSPSQERLWFIDQLEGSVAYHIPMILQLDGKVDIDALEATFRSVVRRHEILRTVYVEENGVVEQQVISWEHWKMPVMRNRQYDRNRVLLDQAIHACISRRFDLSQDHMLRCELLQISDNSYILSVVLHHIAGDGWSMPLLVKELIQTYQRFQAGELQPLAAPVLQYRDYAMWQRSRITQQSEGLAYWQQQLDGITPLQLPADRNRSGGWSGRGAAESIMLDEKLSAQINTVSVQNGLTPFMLLLGVFKL
ncbi:MAG: amino acid adenylation domain-containing protein, partial [Chitinophagaceae bacterium]